MEFPARFCTAYSISLAMSLAMTGCERRETGTVVRFVAENDIVQLTKWIKAGGDPDYTTKKGRSLLYIATGPHGGADVVSVLLRAGADPNLGAHGHTPLMNAASWCDIQAVSILLEYGADPTLENSRGKTALQCIGMCEYDNSIRVLITHAVDEWHKNRNIDNRRFRPQKRRLPQRQAKNGEVSRTTTVSSATRPVAHFDSPTGKGM